MFLIIKDETLPSTLIWFQLSCQWYLDLTDQFRRTRPSFRTGLPRTFPSMSNTAWDFSKRTPQSPGWGKLAWKISACMGLYIKCARSLGEGGSPKCMQLRAGGRGSFTLWERTQRVIKNAWNFHQNDKFLKSHEGTNWKEDMDVVCKAFKLG